jgi:ferredoxin-NADP reductase
MRDDKLVRRSYSLAMAPNDEGRIEFAASYVSDGFASELLFNLKPDDTVQATGPFGRLILPSQPEQRIICVATGTGVTPYRTMLPAFSERIARDQSAIVLLEGVRTHADLLYADDFRSFAATHPLFTFIPCLSRETATTMPDDARQGYVHEQFESLLLLPKTDLFFLCGNPNMIDAAFSKLTSLGFDSSRIKREKYISS